MRYRQFYDRIKTGGLTLRRRFMMYVALAIVASGMMLLLLLSLFGVLNPANSRIEDYLVSQLDNHAVQTVHDVDKMAAYSLAFSQQMSVIIDDYLAHRGMSFDDLKNNVDALTELQNESYLAVYTNIRIAPCSGAFYILDTTVNDTMDVPLRNGIYLKFANLYAESTVNTKVSLFRGSAAVARSNGINLSSTWQNEMKTDAFDDVSIFEEYAYTVSDVEIIPDTWERARYIYSPIYADDGSIIGICGFEVSDLYMELAYSADDTESSQIVCVLFDKTDKGYKGQFISNRSGYAPPLCDTVTVKKHGSFYEYKCGNHHYIGKERDVEIAGNTLTVAMMLPKAQYESIIRDAQMKSVAIFFIIALAAFCACLWLSKKYITPIRKSINQFKTNKTDYTPSGIIEIDDLFAFLAQKDRENEEAFAKMESQKTQIENILEQVSSEHSEAKQEIARLAYSRKSEIDPDDYEHFLMGVKTLTKMERTVFEYYLEGKKVREIVELLGIKESTVRFHNRNIYSKLGVNSLKQLILYASVMNGEERNKKDKSMAEDAKDIDAQEAQKCEE